MGTEYGVVRKRKSITNVKSLSIKGKSHRLKCTDTSYIGVLGKSNLRIQPYLIKTNLINLV